MKTQNHQNAVTTEGQVRSPLAGALDACRTVAAKFNELKSRVARRLAGETGAGVPENLLKQAISEAEALAWATSYPLLFLPVLAEEKVADLRRWEERQRRIRGLAA